LLSEHRQIEGRVVMFVLVGRGVIRERAYAAVSASLKSPWSP